MANGTKAEAALDLLRQANQILKKSNNDNIRKASDCLNEAIRLINKA